MLKNFFSVKLTALLAALIFAFAAVGLAEVKMYTGVGTCTIGDIGTPAQAKNIAKEKAMQSAREQAGVYLKTFSRTANTKLADNEISAITNNIIGLVGEVKYKQTPGEVNGQPVITYEATLEAKIDTDGIKDWLTRDEKEKVTIVKNNEAVQKDIKENLQQIDQLNTQYNQAAPQEKEQIKQAFNEADKKLLASQKLDEGLALYYKGDYDGAIRLYNEALALYPDYADAYNSRGNAYDGKGEYDKAIADYSKALELNPNYAGFYYNRGNAYRHKGDYDKAIADYSKAVDVNPNYAEAYNNRGLAYGNKGDYDRAIADYNKALDFNPDDADAYNNRGTAYDDKGYYDRAIAEYSKALELNPNYAKAYYNRGNAYRHKGDYDKAIADYSKAVDVNPNYANAYNNRGNAYSDKGDYDRAFADYNKALELNPNLAEAYYNRGTAYGKKGDYDRAIADWRKYLEFYPDDADAKKNIQIAEEAKRRQ